MNSAKKYKVAILISHPIHYLIDLYKELNKQPEAEIMVYFCSDFGVKSGFDKSFGKTVKWYDDEILNGLPHKFLKNYSLHKNIGGFFSVINPQIIFELKKNRYDAVIVHGYNYFTNMLAVLAANIFKIPVLFRGESHLLNYRSPFIDKLKKFFLPFFFKKIAAFLAIGTLNTDYYRFYGAKSQKIFLAPYAVNNSYFKKLNEELDKKILKKKYGLNSDSTVILYLAKLIKRKGPLDLIRAYEIAKEKIKNNRTVELVFVGDGPERKSLEKHAKENKLQDIHFFGFRKPEELPEFYAIADIFVLPSSFETWGVAINEAMNFGLPIITTDMVGSAYDLVKNGENGFIYRAGHIEELANNIKTLAENRPLRKKMSENSLEIIKNWSFKETIGGIITVLNFIKNPRVLVANPGSHHLWRTAVALESAGFLKYYATSIYRPRFLNLLKFVFPEIRQKLEQRSHSGLNADKVKTFGFYEWLRLLINKFIKSSKLDFYLIERRNENFSKRAGKLVQDSNIIWVAMDGALESFKISKKRGVKCVLDQFVGHPLALNKILEEEEIYHPEIKNITKDKITADKLKRLLREIELADFIIGGSEFVKNTLLQNGVPERKIKIITYGIDSNLFKPAAKKNEERSFFNILFVGNISVRKGSHYLLKAMRELDSSRFKLKMVGQMEDKYFLEEFGNCFEWISKVPHNEMPKFYQEADIYVYPSLFEGSSLSIYEAMASGLPVITTENSGSVVRNGKDGFIIPIRDIEAIKEKILLLNGDEKLRRETGINARKQVENYKWKNYSERVVDFVKTIS